MSDPALDAQLRTLVGLGAEHKPFECVGDPDESAVALTEVSRPRTGATSPRWATSRANWVPNKRSTTSSNRKDPAVSRPTGFADLAGQRVGIFGYGVEGRATRRRLEGVTDAVVLVDDADDVDPE